MVLASLVIFCLQSESVLALDLRIRNDFDKAMTVAVVYFDAQAQKWRTRGWFTTEARSERKVSINAARTDIYIYAQLAGMSMTWGVGDVTRTVTREAFSYFDGQACPPGNNRRQVNFTKYKTQNNLLVFRPRASSADAPLKFAGEAPAKAPATPSAIASTPQKVDRAVELLNLINAERIKAGVPALKLNTTITRAANHRASELKRKYAHDRPDGRKYHTVFAEFGLSPRASAENIAWRSGSQSHTNMASFNKAFMDSPGHRVNMLNRNYSSVGLGFSEEGNKHYVVELFVGN